MLKFSVGDSVIGNSDMGSPSNRGRKAEVTAVSTSTVCVRWLDGGTGTGIAQKKFDFLITPAVCDVDTIGKEILTTLAARGKQYDKGGEKERSMAKTVEAFNAITGQDLTAVQGWAFMQVLKQVRFFSNTSAPHRDSLIDNGAYALLQAEEALNV